MPVMSRQEVRKIFVDAMEDVGMGLTVFNGRHIDALHDAVPACIVSFESIDVEQDLSDGFMFHGTVSAIILVNGDDDKLDTYIDPAIASTFVYWRTQMPSAGCQLIDITYQKDFDPGIVAAQLTWQVDFNA